jgi:hypothetical protein
MNSNHLKIMFLAFFAGIVFLLSPNLFGQSTKANYDENLVPKYVLPDPLLFNNGEKVKNTADWNKRRKEVLAQFGTEMFGLTPSRKLPVTFAVTSIDTKALKGKATRKEVTAWFTPDQKGPLMVILIYLPNNMKTPAPLFFGMNFNGNHAIQSDTGISLAHSWVENDEESGIDQHKATERSRGSEQSRWPVERIIDRGYGVATVYYGDLDPDFNDGFQNGIQPLFYENGQRVPKANEWGSIGAWAWGCSRAMDYFETDKAIDKNNVIILGHSRLGKTALWAGAQDERFAMVISNNSGCGGAALSKRCFGETLSTINTVFPHWFCENFKKYNNNEAALPFDQHMLLALIAPRPLYVTSAEDDLWADPQGEFLSAMHASVVYTLLGKEGLPANIRPQINEPIMGSIGCHIRSGKHDVTNYDWDQFMNFADKHFSDETNTH